MTSDDFPKLGGLGGTAPWPPLPSVEYVKDSWGGTSIFASGCEFGSGQDASSREVPPADPAGVSHNTMTTHLDRGE